MILDSSPYSYDKGNLKNIIEILKTKLVLIDYENEEMYHLEVSENEESRKLVEDTLLSFIQIFPVDNESIHNTFLIDFNEVLQVIEDCNHIVSVLKNHGYTVVPRVAYNLWKSYSIFQQINWFPLSSLSEERIFKALNTVALFEGVSLEDTGIPVILK